MAGDISGVAIFGAVTGGLGLTLSVLNFLRDGARVQVKLTWDMEIIRSDGSKKGLIEVLNVGRRPVLLSHVHLTGQPDRVRQMVVGGIQGETQTEGAPPRHVIVNQEESLTSDIGRHWWRVRAATVDGAGRTHYSPWPLQPPSFASAKPPLFRLALSRLLNWLHRVRPW